MFKQLSRKIENKRNEFLHFILIFFNIPKATTQNKKKDYLKIKDLY